MASLRKKFSCSQESCLLHIDRRIQLSHSFWAVLREKGWLRKNSKGWSYKAQKAPRLINTYLIHMCKIMTQGVRSIAVWIFLNVWTSEMNRASESRNSKVSFKLQIHVWMQIQTARYLKYTNIQSSNCKTPIWRECGPCCLDKCGPVQWTTPLSQEIQGDFLISLSTTGQNWTVGKIVHTLIWTKANVTLFNMFVQPELHIVRILIHYDGVL